MAYQPKSYRKFLAGTVSAAVVASAFTPAVSADETTTSFTDVNDSFWAAKEIYTLVEKEIIKGYEDGTFKPSQAINRGQAANLLTNALKLEVPSDLKSFEDVSEKSAYAEGAAATKAAGIFNGSANGTIFGAGDELTREQMASVLVRAFGLEATDEEITFTDMDKISQSHRENVMILAQNGITTGKADGSFAPKESVNRATFATFLYRALVATGEIVEAPEVAEITSVDSTTLLVKVKGELTEVTATDFTFDGGLEVKNAEIVTDEVTAAEEVYTTVKLTTSVQEAGKAYNLVTFMGEEVKGEVVVEVPAATTPEVVGVSAINLKTITVTFNKAVKETDAESASNVKLYDGSTATSVTRTLSEDGKTLYISGTFTQGKEYKLTVEGLKTTEGLDVSNYETKVTTIDTVMPVANGAVLTSPKTLELQFSEPVDFPTSSGVLTDIVQIDGINVYASSIDTTALHTEGKVTITLGVAVKAGAHKVKVANVKDFANFPILAKEFDVNLAEDNAAPSVSNVEVIANDKLRVTFNEVVDQTTVAASNASLRVLIPGKADNDVTIVTKKSSTVYEFTLATPLDLSAVVQAKLAYKNIKDNYGNEVKEEQTFQFTAQDDTTAPSVTDYTVNSSNNVEVTFSESVKNVGTADFELLDKDGKVVSGGITNVVGKTIDNATSDKVFVVSLASALDKSGVYTVKIVKGNDISDLSIRGNSVAETSLNVTLADKKSPEISSAKYELEAQDADLMAPGDQPKVIVSDSDYSDSKITITFNEAMDTATLTNKANYLLGDVPLSDMSGVTIAVSSDAKTVVITLNKTTGSPDNFGTLKLLAVKDAAGNTLATAHLNKNLNTPVGNYGAYAPTVAFNDSIKENDVQLVAKNKIKVSAETGYIINGVDPNKLTVVQNDGSTLVAQIAGVAIASDGKSVELTLSSDLKSNATHDETGAIKLKAATDAISFDGNIKTDAQTSGVIVDKVKASLVVADADSDSLIDVNDNNNTVTLTFDENVYANNDALTAALVIKDKDGNRLATSAYSIAVDPDAADTGAGGTANAKTVVITLLAGSETYAGSYTISLTDNVVLKDTVGNVANDIVTITTESLTVESTDLAAANVVIAQITAATIKAEIEAARTAYAGLSAEQKALVTNEAALQTKEQALVDAVTLTPAAVYAVGTTPAGAQVAPTPQAGFTFAITGSSDPTKIDNNGLTVAVGAATLTYTVTHTSSGKTATKTMSVTVIPD